jgi:hypothetical protein
MHNGRLIWVEAQQPRLALAAKGMPDNIHPQVGGADTLRRLSHAGQMLDFARVELIRTRFAKLVLGVVGMCGLLFGLLLIASEK